MRTSTAAWAAALAAMSMRGPFTTAEAAPFRPAEQERPRPLYGKLKRRQGFNDSDPSDPDGLGLPSLAPLLGVSSSSSSAPAVAAPTPSDPAPSDPNDDPVPLVGSILGQPDSTSSPTSTRIPLTTSVSEPLDATSTGQPDNDPLLGSITGQLSNIIPTSSTSGTIVVGITTVIQQTTTPVVPSIPGTLNSGPDSTQSGLLPNLVSSVLSTGNILPTPSGVASNPFDVTSRLLGSGPVGTGLSGLTGTAVPSFLSSAESAVTIARPTGIIGSGSILPPLTGTGGVPIPNVAPTGGLPGVATSILPPGVSGPGTGPAPNFIPNASPLVSSLQSEVTPNLTATLDSITSNPSQITDTDVPIVTGGTGNSAPPAGSTFTATVDGTSVIVTVPDNSAAKTGLTAPPDSTSTATQPIVTASNETESTQTSDASQRPITTESTTTNDTALTPSRTNTPSTSVLPTPPSSTTPPAATTTSVQPQVSIVATGTDTQTTLSLPTVWSFAPSSSNTEPSGTEGIASATTATVLSGSAFPTTMPKLVQPATGMPNAPANFTLVQVGFNFGLNYPFVVGKPESASQIFAYLPRGIAFGLGISQENVLMNALMPYDTSQSLGYITTLAQTYIPAELVNELQLHLHSPSSPIYGNPSSPVNALMAMVNPTIPILPGAAMDGYSSSSSFNPAATTKAGEGDGAPIGGDSGSAKKVSGASVGIGLGAIGGAAVYAAAMIYVARRYRQKRKSHQRASSVPTAGEMTQRSSGGGMGTLFMSGANGRNSPRTLVSGSGARNSRTSNNSSNGRSVREQGISAPLMSENSLGWD